MKKILFPLLFILIIPLFTLAGNTEIPFSPQGKNLYSIMATKDKQAVFTWYFSATKVVMYQIYYENSKTGPFTHISNLNYTQDGKTLYYTAEAEDFQWYAYLGKEKFGPYLKITEAVVSPDGKAIAYLAFKKEGWFIYKNSQKIDGPFDEEPSKIAFYEKGKSLTYQVFRQKGTYYYYNKKEAGMLVQPVSQATAIDDSTVIYAGLGKNNTYTLIQPNGQSGSYEDMGEIMYLKKSNTLAFKAKTEQGWFVFNGSKKAGPYKWIDKLSAHPNGIDLIYTAEEPDKEGTYLYTEKKIFGPYSSVPEVKYSPSQILAFVSQGENGYSLNYNSIESGPYMNAGFIEFGLDGKSIYYAYEKNSNGEWYVSANGTTYGPYNIYSMKSLTVSPDGKKVAILTHYSNDLILYENSQKITGPVYNIAELKYSPDSKTLSFLTNSGSEYYVYQGKEKFGPYYQAFNTLFSGDSKTFQYTVYDEKSYSLYVNKQKQKAFYQIFEGGQINFDGSISFLKVLQDEIADTLPFLRIGKDYFVGTFIYEDNKVIGYIYYKNGKVIKSLF